MGRIEYYVQKVVDYTSRYNYSNSFYYSPNNVIGKYEHYPAYGDFPEAYCLRHYGNWLKCSEKLQPNYRPQDYDPLGAQDYIIVQFEGAVLPKDICVYEVFNPGAVVRIWGKLLFRTDRPWILLWEGAPEKLPHNARKFHPKIREVNYLINTIRLEFNQSHLEYHYSIEAILLGGYKPASQIEKAIMSRGISSVQIVELEASKMNISSADEQNNRLDCFSYLPNEVILHIFQYLDLKSLSRCSRVNKRWNFITSDAILYQNLNLKPYWHLVNCDTIKCFMDKSKTLKKLDLSWCGNDIDGFDQLVAIFIGTNQKFLTHLSLANCNFLNCQIMLETSKCGELVDLRLNNVKSCFTINFSLLTSLNKLVCLDLTSTNIHDCHVISILKSNPHLSVIILDLCENIQRLDQVVDTAVEYNKKLSTWSSWKTFSLTAEGVKQLSNCHNLTELDLGWCFVNKDPGNCLNYIAEGCPKLKRLILSEWRGLTDNLIAPILKSCKELTQLDFLGIKNISSQICEKALMSLPKLQLLDLYYCDSISMEEVNLWRQKYPHVIIKVFNECD
ncbi:F-box/LRR-repeat protein 4-like isoform X1 [Diorhabda carinulata]|uniref:F-box/LRR-repeat protein 4-like isoform X1 n=1 Tax=Diorhabda carinulata TaxID=1163345 RepID=UPI0025A02DC9|nr:F-box/LRR-repeat protein 4-like isoform X1 [Diorhabda carinulata]